MCTFRAAYSAKQLNLSFAGSSSLPQILPQNRDQVVGTKASSATNFSFFLRRRQRRLPLIPFDTRSVLHSQRAGNRTLGQFPLSPASPTGHHEPESRPKSRDRMRDQLAAQNRNEIP